MSKRTDIFFIKQVGSKGISFVVGTTSGFDEYEEEESIDSNASTLCGTNDSNNAGLFSDLNLPRNGKHVSFLDCSRAQSERKKSPENRKNLIHREYQSESRLKLPRNKIALNKKEILSKNAIASKLNFHSASGEKYPFRKLIKNTFIFFIIVLIFIYFIWARFALKSIFLEFI